MERQSTIKADIRDVEVHVTEFDDKSRLLLIEDRSGHGPEKASAPLSEKQARTVARALSPLYVVKSEVGNYATFQPVHDDQNSCDVWNRSDPALCWTSDRSRAACFTSKDAAKTLAAACWPSAGPRVVRLR